MAEVSPSSGSVRNGGEKRKKPSDKDLDLNNAQRGVWLVKVPKYISDRWESSAEGAEVGRLRITRRNNMKPNVEFSLSDAVVAARKGDGEDNIKVKGGKDKDAKSRSASPVPVGHKGRTDKQIPKEHKFVVQSVAAQTLAVFSHTSGANAKEASSKDAKSEGGDGTPATPLLAPGPDKLSLEGRVVQRAECRPISDGAYMSLKREAILRAIEPTRQTQQLDKAVVNFKPVANHAFNKAFEAKKKAEGKKSRDDREKVTETLFALFEKHQYYNIKDLVRETRQPVTYLKEILKEVCNYNLKNPHKNMWELKPEYRHYKAEEKPKEDDDEDKDSSDEDD